MATSTMFSNLADEFLLHDAWCMVTATITVLHGAYMS